MNQTEIHLIPPKSPYPIIALAVLEKEVLVRLVVVPAATVDPKAVTDTHHVFPPLPFLGFFSLLQYFCGAGGGERLA